MSQLLDAAFGKSPGMTLTRGLSYWSANPMSVIPISTANDGATITFDLSLSSWWQVTLGGNRTLALSNVQVGQQFSIILIQGSGGQTVTWFSSIKWPSGSAPTLSSSAAAIDIFTIKCYGTATYYGFTVGQAMA